MRDCLNLSWKDRLCCDSWKRSWIFNLALIRGVPPLKARSHTYANNLMLLFSFHRFFPCLFVATHVGRYYEEQSIQIRGLYELLQSTVSHFNYAFVFAEFLICISLRPTMIFRSETLLRSNCKEIVLENNKIARMDAETLLYQTFRGKWWLWWADLFSQKTRYRVVEFRYIDLFFIRNTISDLRPSLSLFHLIGKRITERNKVRIAILNLQENTQALNAVKIKIAIKMEITELDVN